MSFCILLTPLPTVITLIRNSLHRNFHAILTSVRKRKLERYTRKVKVLSLPETIKKKLTVRAKALRRELIVGERAFARNVDFFFIVSGSERTFTFRVSLKYTTYTGNVSSRKIYSFSHKYVPSSEPFKFCKCYAPEIYCKYLTKTCDAFAVLDA